MEEIPMDDDMLMDLTGAAQEDTAQAAQLDAQVQEHSTADTNRDAMKLLTELNDTEDLADGYHQDPSQDNMAELVSYIENLYNTAKNLDQFKLAHHREIDKQNDMIRNLIKHFSQTNFKKGQTCTRRPGPKMPRRGLEVQQFGCRPTANRGGGENQT